MSWLLEWELQRWNYNPISWIFLRILFLRFLFSFSFHFFPLLLLILALKLFNFTSYSSFISPRITFHPSFFLTSSHHIPKQKKVTGKTLIWGQDWTHRSPMHTITKLSGFTPPNQGHVVRNTGSYLVVLRCKVKMPLRRFRVCPVDRLDNRLSKRVGSWKAAISISRQLQVWNLLSKNIDRVCKIHLIQ